MLAESFGATTADSTLSIFLNPERQESRTSSDLGKITAIGSDRLLTQRTTSPLPALIWSGSIFGPTATVWTMFPLVIPLDDPAGVLHPTVTNSALRIEYMR